MKMTKKVLAVLLAMMMAFSMFAISASAEGKIALKQGTNSLESGKEYVYTALASGVYEFVVTYDEEDATNFVIEDDDYSLISSEEGKDVVYLQKDQVYGISVTTNSKTLKMDVSYKGEILTITPTKTGLQYGYDVQKFYDDNNEVVYGFDGCTKITALFAQYDVDWLTAKCSTTVGSGINSFTVSGFGTDRTLTANIFKVTDIVKGVTINDKSSLKASVNFAGMITDEYYPESITVNLENGTAEAKLDKETGYYTFTYMSLYTVNLVGDYFYTDNYGVQFVVADDYDLTTEFATVDIQLDALSSLFANVARIIDMIDGFLASFAEMIESILNMFA